MARLALSLLVPPLLAVYVLILLVTFDMEQPRGQYLLILPISYVLGSIPWGYLLAYAVKGVDIRRYGSGMTGTSNVLRTVGGPLACIALILDLSKGLLAVLLARAVADATLVEVAAGLLALVGHNWSVFLGFKGGRGIVTGLGGLLIMAPIAGAIAVASFTPITLLSRYLSLGSIISVIVAFLSILAMSLMEQSSIIYLWYTGIGGAIIIWQHRDNIRRLLKGNERRLGQPADQLSEASGPSPGRG